MVKDNYKRVQGILVIILLMNWLVAILKIVIGTCIKSTSMTADGLHSLTDGISNIVGLIGIGLASKPEDKEHPYGHNKYETLCGVFIAVLLFFVGSKIIINAIHLLQNPVKPEITVQSLLVLIITLMINIAVSTAEYRKGKELSSLILVSDSMHTRSDIFVSIGVLITVTGIKLGLPPVMDAAVSLVVAVFIFHGAYEVGKTNCNILLDRVVVDTEEIKKIVMSFDMVKDTHKIRSRGTLQNLYIDMHVMVEPYLNISETHTLVHEIENAIRSKMNENAQVIVHLEPYTKERISPN
ncbi:cation diffusion facilitator family transporter [Anaerocolumna xylanovorans]|uniref:Cation diffusion facilitator family transporter n=1 Tax=Anaerocolumna xylanovorans DSM 12503 TaxID=1121345 RepID=A0A1M7Y1G7_9FIRM|nr:cation diffusion facilitator family transporter [Anaerocolumna xylanovorans]SHO45612.1 cation diffusion facilitator family transporter [Anaerocolumna xylanovorans DSM 12503]